MNNQIEEYIAFVEMQNELCDKPCDICKMYGKGCLPGRMAKKLANKGYRKSTDVAREIFAELDDIPKHQPSYVLYTLLTKKIAELKKKYESEGAE